jgi:hypothetical protein
VYFEIRSPGKQEFIDEISCSHSDVCEDVFWDVVWEIALMMEAVSASDTYANSP